MNRFLGLTVTTFGLCSTLAAQSGWVGRLSSVPLWPQSGDISGFPTSQYVYLEPVPNNYVVAIRAQDGSVGRIVRAPIHSAVTPVVTTSVSMDSAGLFHYTYVLSNGSSARAQLEKWALAIENVGHQMAVSHPSWKGGQTDAKLPGISRDQHEVYQWVSPSDGALAAGQTISGFEVVSDLAPGYILSAFYGKASTPELTPEDWASLPESAAAQLRSALGTAWDSQTLQVIGPRFTPGAGLMSVEANYLFGVRKLKRITRIAKYSAFVNELESTLSEALYHPEAPVTASGLDSLKPIAASGEAEALTALKLALASLQVN
jgi:hypothetical protein